VATEPDVPTEHSVATDPDWSSEPPPSSFAGSVYLSRDSEVHRPLGLPLSILADNFQELEENPPHTTSAAHPPPLRGCPAYENLTVREKLDVSLQFLEESADGIDWSLQWDSIVQIFSCPKQLFRYCCGKMATEARRRFVQSKKKSDCTTLDLSLYNRALTGSATSSVRETFLVEGEG